MKQVLLTRGGVIVDNVPAPLVDDDSVLVEVAYSFISVGTEMSGVNQAQKSFAKQAVEQPEKVKKLVEHFRQQGIQKTIAKVKEKVDAGTPLGYSCSGIVIQVGKNIKDIEPGQLVACAGAGKANHAEIVQVPRNLIVKVPDGCNLRDAASVTLGAIAMQGVRQADTRLGEIVAVIGLGLLGQLTIQLLTAAGCRVIGIDLDQRRVDLADNFKIESGLNPAEVNIENEIRHLTGGHGVDVTIITAASQSDAIVQQAMEITRKKGRIVVVGAVGLGLKRSPFYEKELDFLISCSYGPGRYEPNYEDKGLDYPYAYVRWTENRNMIEFLRLLAENKIDLDSLIEREYDISDAPKAYQELQTATEKPLGVFLCYPINHQEDRTEKLKTRVNFRSKRIDGKINVAVIGAGGFAKGTHLPNLQKLSNLYHIRAIVSATGSNAKATAQQYDADYATTNFQDVLDDPLVDMVLISTRHHLHVQQSIAAAKAGKAIFLEKPMALNQTDLDKLVMVLKETKVPFMVGFNRRFSPAAQRAKEILKNRKSPLMIMYRMNAGYIPLDHWVHTDEGGGRVVGEACHILDFFQYFINPAHPVEISPTSITPSIEHISSTDNTVITIQYSDGSIASLLYTSLGASDFPKEYVEIYADGKTLIIDDYKSLHVYGSSMKNWKSIIQDKGHLEELKVFAKYIQEGNDNAITLTELIQTTSISFNI